MFKLRTYLQPKSAKRPTFVPQFKRVVTPLDYRQYKNKLITEFNEYALDEKLKDVLFNAKYGINLKIKFYFDRHRSKKPFHRQKPDLDNLVKATVDALFESKVNKELVGYEEDDEGNQISKYKQIVDDSNIVRMELIKMNVGSEEVGQEITLSKILEEELEK